LNRTSFLLALSVETRNAFVKADSWDDGVFGAFGPNAYQRRSEWPNDIPINYTYYQYFSACEPVNCYYDAPAGGGLLFTMLLGLVGGLVPLITVPLNVIGGQIKYLAGKTFEQRQKKGEK
jgi:hypothetical protein